jgi:type IV pilus assembly protein PilW
MTRTRFQHSPAGAKPRNRGFSLVEIMVALVIGMIGVIVIMQVARTAEAQKRATTGAGNAQISGALAIYTVERDVKQAGYGINSLGVLGCRLTIHTSTPAHTLSVLAPVIINPAVADVPAGDDNTDTLLIVYGNSAGTPEGDIATKGRADQVWVKSLSSFRDEDWVIAGPLVPESGCVSNMGRIDGEPTSSLSVPDIGARDNDIILNLGAEPKIMAYAIRNGNLTACNYMEGNCGAACTSGHPNCNDAWQIIADGVVGLRAQYGHAGAPQDGIDDWDQTTPVNTGTPKAYACRWASIPAVRLAVVARNSEPVREDVTAEFPAWPPNGGDAVIDLSSVPTPEGFTWKNYRYQTYEAVVPLRNIPWIGEGCSSS